ncbi:MAG: FkbM family methyltransferase [Oligoflexia bacterium]|nr:FkbM family methyltransferase [Oligoflexia bacterium]
MKRKIKKAHLLALPFIFFIQFIGLLTEIYQQKGLWHSLNFMARVLPKTISDVDILLNKDSVFPVSLNDPYWSRLLYLNYKYEPEIDRIFSSIQNLEFDVFDCGANHGYWSLLFSSELLGGHSVVSLESNPLVYSKLVKNISLNNRKNITALGLAISDKNKDIYFHIDKNHADSRIVTERTDNSILVKSESLSSIINTYKKTKNVLIKLDIEGAELDALNSLDESQIDSTFIIYEDHGRDDDSMVTDFILNKLRMSVFYVTKKQVLPIEKAIDLKAIKTNKKLGYNLVAFRKTSTIGLEFKRNLC